MDVLKLKNEMNERFTGVEKLCHDTVKAVGRVSEDLADVLRRLDAMKPNEDLSESELSDDGTSMDDPTAPSPAGAAHAPPPAGAAHAPPPAGAAHVGELSAPRGSVLCVRVPAEREGGCAYEQAGHPGNHALRSSDSHRKESQVTFGKTCRLFSQRRSSEVSQTSCTGGAVGTVAGKMRRSSDWIATIVKSLNRGSYADQDFQGGQERASSRTSSSTDRVSRISQWHNLSRGRELAAKEVMSLGAVLEELTKMERMQEIFENKTVPQDGNFPPFFAKVSCWPNTYEVLKAMQGAIEAMEARSRQMLQRIVGKQSLDRKTTSWVEPVAKVTEEQAMRTTQGARAREDEHVNRLREESQPALPPPTPCNYYAPTAPPSQLPAQPIFLVSPQMPPMPQYMCQSPQFPFGAMAPTMGQMPMPFPINVMGAGAPPSYGYPALPQPPNAGGAPPSPARSDTRRPGRGPPPARGNEPWYLKFEPNNFEELNSTAQDIKGLRERMAQAPNVPPPGEPYHCLGCNDKDAQHTEKYCKYLAATQERVQRRMESEQVNAFVAKVEAAKAASPLLFTYADAVAECPQETDAKKATGVAPPSEWVFRAYAEDEFLPEVPVTLPYDTYANFVQDMDRLVDPNNRVRGE